MSSRTLTDALAAYAEDPSSVRAALSALTQMHIAPRVEGEFIAGRNGVLIPHERAGLVIRIETNKYCTEHPLVGPAIPDVRAGEFHIELAFGGRTAGIGSYEVEWLSKALEADNIKWTDHHNGNAMRLPLATPDHPLGLPVVLDRDYIRPGFWRGVTHYFNRLKPAARLEDYGVTPAQAQSWRHMQAELGTAFKQAWPDGHSRADPARMHRFWQIAESYTTNDFKPGQIGLFRGWGEIPALEPVYVRDGCTRHLIGSKSNSFANAAARYHSRTAAPQY